MRGATGEPRQSGCEVMAAVCDTTDDQQATRFVQTVIDHRGGIDVLINNAGIIQVGPIESMSRAGYEQSIATHFWGPLYLIEASHVRLTFPAQIGARRRVTFRGRSAWPSERPSDFCQVPTVATGPSG